MFRSEDDKRSFKTLLPKAKNLDLNEEVKKALDTLNDNGISVPFFLQLQKDEEGYFTHNSLSSVPLVPTPIVAVSFITFLQSLPQRTFELCLLPLISYIKERVYVERKEEIRVMEDKKNEKEDPFKGLDKKIQ